MSKDSKINTNWEPNIKDALKDVQIPGKETQLKINDASKKSSGGLLDITKEISEIQNNITDSGS